VVLGPWLCQALFGISPNEAAFERRGFELPDGRARSVLEGAGRSFVGGYNAELAGTLTAELGGSPRSQHGFVVEGAAMACGLVDSFTPWRRHRVRELFVRQPGHLYMIHVGAGWATARLRGSLRRALRRFDGALCFLVADGWGFHQAYFHPRRWASGRRRYAGNGDYIARAVDQGIGRALWFVAGADPERAARHVMAFSADRHPDLWSGLGLAATYATGAQGERLSELIDRAGPLAGHLAQGAAFAATARVAAQTQTAACDEAATALTGRTSTELAALCYELAPAPRPRPEPDAYEGWRSAVRDALAVRKAA
jgi:enediyne biosynthesis protein E3